MRLPMYQVDAFTDSLFGGNPAAVCPLPAWLPDATMQAIAAENNLAETAFFVRAGGDYALRWFTPTVEVDLCGHATLASGHVVLRFLEPQRDSVGFHTAKAGTLVVSRSADALAMDFPARPAVSCEAPAGLLEALGGAPREVLRARDHLVVYETAAEIAALKPDLVALGKVDCWAAIVTARRGRHRFRVAFLRAGARRSRRSGDRLGALHAGALLGETLRQNRVRGAPAVAPRRRPPLHAQRRSREHRREGRCLPGRADRGVAKRVCQSSCSLRNYAVERWAA
jgi:Phenazine biosynthesis-like protein